MSANDITRILRQIDAGSATSAELLPLVYEELKKLAGAKLAKEKSGQTLHATALVHEAYLRLAAADQSPRWDSRGHFFAAAAAAMRRILVDNARRKRSAKHGGGKRRQQVEADDITAPEPDEQLICLHDALTRLAETYPLHARIVELRYFAGLTGAEAAGILKVSTSTADRHWVFARAWLRRELEATTNFEEL